MLRKYRLAAIAFSLPVLLAPRAYSQHDQDGGGDGGGLNNRNGIRRVLLISIDGMHAVDYQNCVKAGTGPNLAELGENAIIYTRTSTSRPSDSFPGLMALVTGGTPK